MNRLDSLHQHEEELRTESLVLVDSSTVLNAHRQALESGMDVAFMHSRDSADDSDDALQFRALGIRLFNSAGGALKLALSGWYQGAFALTRDSFETAALIRHLSAAPNRMLDWRTAPATDRRSRYSPAKVRLGLEEHGLLPSFMDQQRYAHLCEYAAHPTPDSHQLLGPSDLASIGPFVDLGFLQAWMGETVPIVAVGALALADRLPMGSPANQELSDAQRRIIRSWLRLYMPESHV